MDGLNNKPTLSVMEYIDQLNDRLRSHTGFKVGMRFVAQPAHTPHREPHGVGVVGFWLAPEVFAEVRASVDADYSVVSTLPHQGLSSSLRR